MFFKIQDHVLESDASFSKRIGLAKESWLAITMCDGIDAATSPDRLLTQTKFCHVWGNIKNNERLFLRTCFDKIEDSSSFYRIFYSIFDISSNVHFLSNVYGRRVKC